MPVMSLGDVSSLAPSDDPGRTPAGPGATQRARLGQLRRTIDRLWHSEPDAAPSVRSRLLERLADLDHEVERLVLRLHGGDLVDEGALQTCSDALDELAWWWRPTSRDLAARPA